MGQWQPSTLDSCARHGDMNGNQKAVLAANTVKGAESDDFYLYVA